MDYFIIILLILLIFIDSEFFIFESIIAFLYLIMILIDLQIESPIIKYLIEDGEHFF
jgi:hypothetical protein